MGLWEWGQGEGDLNSPWMSVLPAFSYSKNTRAGLSMPVTTKLLRYHLRPQVNQSMAWAWRLSVRYIYMDVPASSCERTSYRWGIQVTLMGLCQGYPPTPSPTHKLQWAE